ncbi:MAG: hypothetical protein DMG08_16640 [Acidobacteria bacterium]|nr:MAG: hypothetical protein DMG08_16640 [Acidobacteriota bacterium]
MSLASLFLIAVGFAVSTLLGYFVTTFLVPPKSARALAWAFAPAVGAGASSLIFFVFRRPIFTVEIALLTLFALGFLARSMLFREPAPPISWRLSLFGLVLSGAVALAVYGLLLRADRMPHGDWDAWAIWNTHARFLHRDGRTWSDHIRYTVHGDYPLLTPSLTARLWRYAGEEAPEAGSLLGIMFALSGVAVLLATLSQLRDIQLALLMALMLIGTPYYLERGVSQYADVPLAVFTISTIALICLHLEREPDRFGPLVLAGFTAGCAGWTKNEGLLFILATCIVLLLPVFRNPAVTFRRFASFSLGLLLPLAVISYFKLAIAPPYDLIEDLRYQEAIQRITSIDRHAVILKSLARSAWFFGAWAMQPMIPLFAFIALRGAGRRVFRSYGGFAGLLILGIVLAGYYAVYLITPIPLQVHLDSSLNRLLIHLWPSFLLVLGLMARSKSLLGSCGDTPGEGEQKEFNSC